MWLGFKKTGTGMATMLFYTDITGDGLESNPGIGQPTAYNFQHQFQLSYHVGGMTETISRTVLVTPSTRFFRIQTQKP